MFYENKNVYLIQISDHLWNPKHMNPITNKLLKIQTLKKVAVIILEN